MNIAYLIENPEDRKIMGENARNRVEKEFDEKIVIKKQLEIFKRLVLKKVKI